MGQIKGTILAEDIKNSDYFISAYCAITRALHRAGHPFRDAGILIIDDKNVPIVELHSNSQYEELVKRVCSMYNQPWKDRAVEEPADFDFEINY